MTDKATRNTEDEYSDLDSGFFLHCITCQDREIEKLQIQVRELQDYQESCDRQLKAIMSELKQIKSDLAYDDLIRNNRKI